MKARFGKAFKKSKVIVRWLRGKVTHTRAVRTLMLLNGLFLTMLLIQTLHPALPGTITVSAQSTLQLGDISIRPIAFQSARENNPFICLLYVGVKVEQRFWDGKLYLVSGPQIYPTIDLLPIGQDSLLTRQQTRVFAFQPNELCQRGPLSPKEISLLLVHPNGVGMVSLAGLEK